MFKAHRMLCHSTLGSRVITKKRRVVSGVSPPPVRGVEGRRAPPKERSAEVTSTLLVAEVTDLSCPVWSRECAISPPRAGVKRGRGAAEGGGHPEAHITNCTTEANI